MMPTEVFINGNNFSDLAGFYDEVERNLTKDLNWKIGRNLNAYNDVLRGGFNVFEYGAPVVLNWHNSEKSKRDLGYDATVRYYESILKTCHPDNIPYVQDDLDRAKAGDGPTVFDIILQITLEHSHITVFLK